MHKDLTSKVRQVSPARKADKYPLPRTQFKVSLLAATLAAGLMLSLPTYAFNLGNLSRLSALGEPLRLEFEVLDLSPSEVESFRVTLESPQSFTARGLGYDPALEGMRLGLVRNAAGRLVIRMEGQRPATEAFVGLLLNISWASGSTIRSVSFLLTPPTGMASAESPRAAASAEPVALAPAAPLSPLASLAALASAPTTTPSPAPPQPNITAAPPSGSAPPQVQPAAPTVNSSEAKVVTKPGDTAGALAQRERPADVDQDQYLLALVQTNPSAFVEGNVNRLLAGAQLQLPTAAQAKVTPAPEARQIIVAQWQEFQALRQQIAAKQPALAPTAPSAPGAQAQGQVDSLQGAASAPSPADKLTLSKPSTAGGGQAEQALLDERQTHDTQARLEELTRTVRELNQLQANAGGTNEAPALTGKANSGDALLTAVAVPAPASDLSGAGLIDRLADHPAVLPAAGGSLAMALAWLGWRLRRKSRGNDDEFDGDLSGMLASNSTSSKGQPEPVANKNAKTDLDLELDLDEEQAASSANSLTAQTLARVREASSP